MSKRALKAALVPDTMPAQYALILIDYSVSQGVERDLLLAGTRVATTDIARVDARIDTSDYLLLASRAAALTGDPALGLTLGQLTNVTTFGPVGQVLANCHNLAQVNQILAEFRSLLGMVPNKIRSNRHRSYFSVPNPGLGLPAYLHHEFTFAIYFSLLKSFIHNQDFTVRVEFPYPKPPHAAQYYALFGKDVHFNRPLGRISYNRKWDEVQLPTYNPTLFTHYRQQCQTMLATHTDDSVAQQTLRLLHGMEGHYPKLPEMAKLFNLHQRTYIRHLEKEGHSYQALLDQVRAEHAMYHLRCSTRPVSSIAHLLGFADSSNFHHAFKRWTGLTVQQFRSRNSGNA